MGVVEADYCRCPECEQETWHHRVPLATDGGLSADETDLIHNGICPVCGDEIAEPGEDLEEGESYDAKICVVEDMSGEDGGESIIHLPDVESTEPTTPEEEWEQHNQSFQYDPPEDPPEAWSSEQYNELYDRVISKERHGFTCNKCASAPLATVEKARRHVESQHMERLLEEVESRQEVNNAN